MDLDQLRAENAALEASQSAPPQDAADETTVDAADGQEDEQQGADLDGSEEGAEAEAEGWMKGDEPESQDAGDAPKVFSHKDIAEAKNRLRAKLEARHQSELDKVKAELEARAQQVPRQTAKPTRDQFYDHDDPDDAYAEALVDWKLNNTAAQQQAQRQQLEKERAHLEHVQAIEASVDQHYARAAKLTEQSGISEELYRAADDRLRTAIDEVKGDGDIVTNILIDLVGEGSERVMYHLGVNKERRDELLNIMRNDHNGLKVAAFLGKLSEKLSAPAKRKSSAPPPASQAKGDESTAETGGKLQRQYKEAHAKGNAQAAFDAKQKAKAAGINTNSW